MPDLAVLSTPAAAARLAERDDLGLDVALAATLAAQPLHRQIDRVLLAEAPHQLADRQRRHMVALPAHRHAHEPARGDRPTPQAWTSRHDPLLPIPLPSGPEHKENITRDQAPVWAGVRWVAGANDPLTIFCQNVFMALEHSLSLRQAHPARADVHAIADDVEFLKAQLARVPTRIEMARLVLLATLTTSALVLAGIEALFRDGRSNLAAVDGAVRSHAVWRVGRVKRTRARLPVRRETVSGVWFPAQKASQRLHPKSGLLCDFI